MVVLEAGLGAGRLVRSRDAGIGATILKHVEGGSLASRLRAIGGLA